MDFKNIQFNAMQANSVWKQIKVSLQEIYSQEEASAIAFRLLEDLAALDKGKVIAGYPISSNALKKIENALAELMCGVPFQYVIGYTWFDNLKINVNPTVLIPRPETEELISIIKQSNSFPKKIVDWCSGSGCIALALKNAYPACEVYGLEISNDAIATAQSSSDKVSTYPIWINTDIFEDWPSEINNCDIIVSNPPYVAHHEKMSIVKHVLNHEPHLALFVPDNDPLLFYRRLLDAGKAFLAERGQLYCEINPIYSELLNDLAKSYDWKNIQILKDMFGKDRFLIASNGD